MSAVERIRYNLPRLVEASGRELADVALRAWPMPGRKTARRWSIDVEQRKQKLSRYLNGTVRPSLRALDDLARALGVDVAEFFRAPSN